MLTTKNLTVHERMVIARKRDGTTQREQAEAYGVGLNEYRTWEKDSPDCPSEALGKLKLNEAMFILRRRAGLTIDYVAEQIGCCAMWVRHMEQGKIDGQRLADFWNS